MRDPYPSSLVDLRGYDRAAQCLILHVRYMMLTRICRKQMVNCVLCFVYTWYKALTNDNFIYVACIKQLSVVLENYFTTSFSYIFLCKKLMHCNVLTLFFIFTLGRHQRKWVLSSFHVSAFVSIHSSVCWSVCLSVLSILNSLTVLGYWPEIWWDDAPYCEADRYLKWLCSANICVSHKTFKFLMIGLDQVWVMRLPL